MIKTILTIILVAVVIAYLKKDAKRYELSQRYVQDRLYDTK